MIMKTETNKLSTSAFSRKQTVSIFLVMLLAITTILSTISITPVYASATSDQQDVYKAKSALVDVGTLKPVQGVDTDIQVMAQKIVNKAVTGVTVKVTWSANPQVNGTAITYGSTAGSGNVAFTLTKNKAVAYATCPVYVPMASAPAPAPAPTPATATTDTNDVYKAKSALVDVGTLKPVQGVDTDIQVMAQKIVNKAVTGVTVKVTWSANPQVNGTAITYGTKAASGNVAFTLTKNKAVAYATCPVYVPAATTQPAPAPAPTPEPTPTPAPAPAPEPTPAPAPAPAPTTSINVKNFGAVGDGIKNDTTAVQNAINSLKSGQTLYFPAGTYLVNSLRVANPTITLDGQGATIKQASTGTADFIVVTANGVTIQNLTIKRDLTNASKLDGIVVRGDNFSMKSAKVDGFYYSIDVSGDYGYIDNVSVQNSGYAGCRLNATSKALNKFTLNNFKVLNSAYKGFVYNGTLGIRDVIVNNFESIYNGTVKADAMDGFLTDSGESTNVYRIKNLVINTANIQVAGSGAFKILNCETATLNNITIKDDRSYSSSRALHSAAKNLYVNGMTANDRIIVFGNADLRNIKFSASTLNFSPLELKGDGTKCTINGFDSSLVSNGTNASIRVQRNSGVVHTVNVENFKGNGNKLFGVVTSFTNIKQSLVVGSNVTGYSSTGL